MKSINHLPSALACSGTQEMLCRALHHANIGWDPVASEVRNVRTCFQTASKENHQTESWFLVPFLFSFSVCIKEKKSNQIPQKNACTYYSTYLLICLCLKNILSLIWHPLSLVNFMNPVLKYGKTELCIMPTFFFLRCDFLRENLLLKGLTPDT